ncbi:twin-arginine translocase subunit TatC [Helicobacter muridarum]|uniref:Sec-independent protein translocase protein TatC n=1 Tax=Helicobacter muridarum TaxID=216 RepID=A0A377PWI1_9HELI|nr:twin-arginine translocase subunit TatC [Helicobacter muridarum]TLE00967.1 twin-arginine translocase subunit TatC [Helicobacter muridarum]STQ86611.1 Sec-independent protein translocase TatC [Helicobacter muridarum]
MLEELRPHIQDLRKRLIISLCCLVVCFMVAFGFHEELVTWMSIPLKNAFANDVGKTIQTAPAEYLFVAIKISLFTGFIVSVPVIFWQIWLFIAPGLYKHEKRLVLPFVFFASIMFASGLLFCYFIVFPFLIKYVIAFGSNVVEANITINEYLIFFVRIMLVFGFVFELPVVAYFFGKIGLVTDETLKHYFRYAIVIIFIIAAIVTPPDVISQLLLALPMVLLYGFAYLILKIVNPASRLDSNLHNTKNDNANEQSTYENEIHNDKTDEETNATRESSDEENNKNSKNTITSF